MTFKAPRIPDPRPAPAAPTAATSAPNLFNSLLNNFGRSPLAGIASSARGSLERARGATRTLIGGSN